MNKNILLVTILLSFLFSCDIVQKTKHNYPKEQLQVLNQHSGKNRELLSKFLSGEVPHPENHKKTIRFVVKKRNEMLNFPTKNDASNFILATEYLTNQWNYENAYQYDNTEKEREHLGNPALNAIDNLYQFNSLRYYYLEKEFDQGINFEKELDFHISDPDFQTYTNTAGEVLIQDTIYKLLKNDIIGMVVNGEEEALAELRKNGASTNNNRVGLYDNITRFKNPITPNPGPRNPQSTTCNLLIVKNVSYNINNDYRQIRLNFSAGGILSPGGSACGYINSITDWGDGFSANNIGVSSNHTYNVNLPVGGTSTFTIKVTSTKLPGGAADCSVCPASKSTNIIVTVANPVANCNDDNQGRSAVWKEFNYQGNNYKIKCENGQRTTSALFAPRKIWARSTFYKKVNGTFRQRKPPVKLYTEIKGKYYTNQCTTISTDVNQWNDGKCKVVCTTFHPNDDFGTIADNNDPDRIITGHKAQFDDNPVYWDHYYLNIYK